MVGVSLLLSRCVSIFLLILLCLIRLVGVVLKESERLENSVWLLGSVIVMWLSVRVNVVM